MASEGVSEGLNLSLYPALFQSTISDNRVTWRLPKSGEKYEGCGKVVGVKACPDHPADRILLFKHCNRAECPVCYEGWATREAGAAVERQEKAYVLYKRNGIDLRQLRHFVFSPPQEYAISKIDMVEGYRKLRSELYEVMAAAGLRGGLVIFHYLRENGEWSPHFHVLAYGFADSSDKVYEKTGWVYKNIGNRETIFGTVFYLLTHCGLGYYGTERFHTVTWFGLLSYNAMKIVSEEKVYETEKCEKCENDLHRYALYWGSDPDQPVTWFDEGVYYLIKTVRTYRLRKKKEKSSLFHTVTFNV